MSAAGTIWLDDVSLLASCDHPATLPAMTYSLPPAVRASYWRFTILDSWNPDGTYAPEPAKGEGPAVEYIQFKNATAAAGAEQENGKQHEEGVAATEAEGGWITETADWTVSGQYHPNGPISHLIAPCDGGFWNAGATPQPWSATVALPGVRARVCAGARARARAGVRVCVCASHALCRWTSHLRYQGRGFSGFRFADAFADEDHLRSFTLEAANSTSNTTVWRLVLNETGLPNHRP